MDTVNTNMTSERESKGPVVGIVVIIILLILGGVYLWQSEAPAETPVDTATTTTATTTEMETQGTTTMEATMEVGATTSEGQVETR